MNNNLTRGRQQLFLLLAVIPCAILIASFSYYTATTVYPECKICKFMAHIFLSGTVVSQAITIPYFTVAIHSVESLVCTIVAIVIPPRTSALIYFVSAVCLIVASIVASAEGCRAPPLKSVQ